MNLFTILTKFAVTILPFYVFFAVFFWYITWFDKVWFFLKEWLLVAIFFSLIYEFIKAKKLPKLDFLDYLVLFYIIYWVWITLYNWLGLNSIVYGWRYDFMFLIVMIIYKHWASFLKVNTKQLITLFVYSWALSLLFWILIKFRLKEEFLVEFWYIDYVSNWVFNWWIPVYHWLENSWIRRFQWILDGPNAKHHKKLLIWLTIFSVSFLWLLWIIFQHQLTNIVFRTSSTTGHFDRMEIWIDRFLEKPLWAWLAESGPAYRNIYPEKQTKNDEVKYIPESWYIQVLIEWWIIFFITFITILFTVLFKLYSKSKIMFGMFFAIMIMNIFLHIFEATYLSMLLFIFVWLFISKK